MPSAPSRAALNIFLWQDLVPRYASYIIPALPYTRAGLRGVEQVATIIGYLHSIHPLNMTICEHDVISTGMASGSAPASLIYIRKSTTAAIGEDDPRSTTSREHRRINERHRLRRCGEISHFVRASSPVTAEIRHQRLVASYRDVHPQKVKGIIPASVKGKGASLVRTSPSRSGGGAFPNLSVLYVGVELALGRCVRLILLNRWARGDEGECLIPILLVW